MVDAVPFQLIWIYPGRCQGLTEEAPMIDTPATHVVTTTSSVTSRIMAALTYTAAIVGFVVSIGAHGARAYIAGDQPVRWTLAATATWKQVKCASSIDPNCR